MIVSFSVSSFCALENWMTRLYVVPDRISVGQPSIRCGLFREQNSAFVQDSVSRDDQGEQSPKTALQLQTKGENVALNILSIKRLL